MISFYPGPSRVHDEIPDYVRDAYKEGILSINHRSAEFMKIVEKITRLLKNKLEIPQDYTIFFTSSANAKGVLNDNVRQRTFLRETCQRSSLGKNGNGVNVAFSNT